MKINTLYLELLLIFEASLLHFCFLWLQPLKILKYFVEIGCNIFLEALQSAKVWFKNYIHTGSSPITHLKKVSE